LHIFINSSKLILLLVIVVVLIVLLALLQPVRRRRRRSQGGLLRRARALAKRRDHGAHVARRNGRERSPEWGRVQREHLLREPACIVCGHRGKRLQVHHIKPFHLHPQLELNKNNLITLCERRGRNHHLLIGHLDSWHSYNEQVRHDAKRFYGKTARQIKTDASWQKKVKQRP